MASTFSIIVNGLVLFVLYYTAYYLKEYGVTAHRGFFKDDPALSYPYKPSSVSWENLKTMGYVFTAIVVGISELFFNIDGGGFFSRQIHIVLFSK